MTKTIDATGTHLRLNTRIETRLLRDRLAGAAPGDVLTFDDLAIVAGTDVRPGAKGYAWLHSAMRQVRASHGLVFESVRGTGWRCVEEAEKLGVARGYVRRARKAVGRSLSVLGAVDRVALTDEQRRLLDAQVSHSAVLAHLTTQKAVNKVVEATHDGAKPTKDVLSLFSS
jgi:hypothetical protein